MNYHRKVLYMNYFEEEEKKGNAGFVKVLENQGRLDAEICLNNIPSGFQGERILTIYDGENIVNHKTLIIEGGKGYIKHSWRGEDVAKTPVFRIQLSDKVYLCTEPLEKKRVERSTIEKSEEVSVKEVQLQEEAEEEEILEEEEESAPAASTENVEKSKWNQIYKTYPHIKPFGDFREYIKLDLKDLIILPERSYQMVENSFLLHGYYNYDHLILWKKEKAPVRYYLGVPGNFYEKEKQVALLYGFESFEGEVEPAKEGDFGYYLASVSI